VDGEMVVNDQYQLVQAEFRAPLPAAFKIPLEKKQLIDRRFGIPVGLPSVPSGVHSLDAALAQTQHTAEEMARARAESERRARRQRVIRMTLIGLLVASLVAFAWVLRGIRRSP